VNSHQPQENPDKEEISKIILNSFKWMPLAINVLTFQSPPMYSIT